jgi:hypothetical protein
MISVSRNLHLETMAMSEVARLMEIIATMPHVLDLSKNPVRGQKDSLLGF